MGFTFAEDRKRARERRAARKAEGLAQKFKNWVAGSAPEPKSAPVQEYQVRIFREAKIIRDSQVVVFAGFVNGAPGVIERDIRKDGNPVVAERPVRRALTVSQADRDYLRRWGARITARLFSAPK